MTNAFERAMLREGMKSPYRRATRGRNTPLTVVKSPPMSTLPSGCNAMERTTLSGPVPGLKLLSRLPLTLNRAIRQSGQRSEEHTSELQSRLHLVCRLLLEKKKKLNNNV